MEKTEFIEVMKTEAEKRGEIVIQTINRTDRAYTGLCVKVPTSVASPVVNLDMCYDKFTSGEWDMDKCIEYLNEILDMKPDKSYKFILDWETAKTGLFLRPFRNVTDGLFEKVANIFLVPYLKLDKGSYCRVVPQLLGQWKVTEEEVFETAKENQETLLPIEITHLGTRLGLPDDLVEGLPPMYIVTTSEARFGASAIFYSDAEERIREIMKGDYFIIPSSVDEVIVVPKNDGPEASDLIGMVKTINATSVEEEDRLADTIYEFVDGKFTEVE